MMQELLRSKFGDCKFATVSNCSGSYENTTAAAFYVYDPPPEANEPVKIVGINENHQLKVNNTGTINVCLVKTDKCLFTKDVSKCDCLLFDTTKFYLIEIKNTNSGGRKASRNKAIRQLGATIDLLKNNGIDMAYLDVSAIVCFKIKNSRPIQAATTTKQAEFLQQYNVVLKEINEIAF